MLKMLAASLRPQELAAPIIRFETEPGEQTQMDWAVIRRGTKRLSVFVAAIETANGTGTTYTVRGTWKLLPSPESEPHNGKASEGNRCYSVWATRERSSFNRHLPPDQKPGRLKQGNDRKEGSAYQHVGLDIHDNTPAVLTTSKTTKTLLPHLTIRR
jgi:hypothetical protein